MDAGNTINRGVSSSWDRLFYSVEIEDSQIVVKERVLNIFQRILRTVFGAYSSTIWTQKKIEDLAWQCPDAVAKINDFVATLNVCNKTLTPVKKPAQFKDLPKDVTLLLLNKLDGESLGRCQRVCKALKRLIDKNPNLWKQNFASKHDGYTPPVRPSIGWRAFYVQQRNVAKTLAAGTFPEPVKLGFDREHIQGGFTRGNELFFVGHNRSELYCHDLITGKQIIMFNELPARAFAEVGVKPQARAVADLTLRPIDSTHFLSVGASQASVWDTFTYACVFAVDNVKNGLVHAEGSRVLYYSNEDCLEVWDFATKTRVTQIKDPSITSVLSKGQYKIIGNVFFALMADGAVHAYDIVEGKKLYTLTSENDRPFTRILATQKHFVATNERLTIGMVPPPVAHENQAYVYSPVTGKLLHVIKLAFTLFPLHKHLQAEITQNQLIGIPRNTAGTVAGTVACWDLERGEIVNTFAPPTGSIYSFTAGGPDRLVITTTRPGPNNIGITIWDLNEGTLLSERNYQGNHNNFFDGTTVKIHNHIMYFGKWPNDAFHFWDLSTATPIGTFPCEYSHGGLWHFDGSRFFVSGNKELEIYNLNQVPPPKSLASRIKDAFF